MNEKQIKELVSDIGYRFSCFGGGKQSWNNPISEVLKDRELMFAMGVSVRDVVEYVLSRANT